MIDGDSFDKLTVPGPEKYSVNYKSVDRHIPYVTFYKTKKPRIEGFKKNNDPSPFTYKKEESYDKT